MIDVDLTVWKWFSDASLKPDIHREHIVAEELNIRESSGSILDWVGFGIVDRNRMFFSNTKQRSTCNLNLTEKDEVESYYEGMGCPRCGKYICVLNSRDSYGSVCDDCDFSLVMENSSRGLISDYQSNSVQNDPLLDRIIEDALSDDSDLFNELESEILTAQD